MHLAIIMDGNRRWAMQNNQSSIAGHIAGVKPLTDIIEYIVNDYSIIKYLSVYAFSTENWNRSEQEVNNLFDLFLQSLTQQLDQLFQNNIKLKFLGDITPLPHNLQQLIYRAEKLTSVNTGLNLQFAINYGSQAEIIQACQLASQDNNINNLDKYLYTKDIPNVDLLIRTGNTQRLSNFLLWQIAYAEIIFDKAMWPDFTVNKLKLCLKEYQSRSRRFGC